MNGPNRARSGSGGRVHGQYDTHRVTFLTVVATLAKLKLGRPHKQRLPRVHLGIGASEGRVALIEKARAWFKGDGVPQPIAGLLDPIDAEQLADELRLVVRGQENGGQETPAAGSTTLDAVEEEISGRIMAEWNLQREHLITMLRAYRDRLAELNAVAELAQLRLSAASAVVKFRQRKQEARGDLARLRLSYVEARDELGAFRVKHGLSRPARNPSHRWTTIGLLVVMIAIESVMNGLFFAKGSERGLIGGVGTAFGISLVNVLVCFFLGLGPARFINWRGWFVRTLGVAITLTGLGAILFVHLFAGHLRDATAATSEAKAYGIAAAQIFTQPWRLADITSWYLFGLGALFGLLSFWKGYRHDDPYPHYGEIYRRERDASDRYNDEHRDFFEELEEVRDDTIKRFEDGIAIIPEYVAKSHQVRAARSALTEQFRGYEQLALQTANRLLTIYRDANRRRRKTPVPAYFATSWSLPVSALSGSDILALSTDAPDSVVTNVDATLAELRSLSEEVLRTYDELLAVVEHPTDMK